MSNNEDTIVLDAQRDGRVLLLRLNRPDSMNALNSALSNALAQAFEEAAGNPEVRVVVLTGAGRAFCAGADLKELLADRTGSEMQGPDVVDAIAAAFDRIRAFPKPIVCALNGLTLAGGLELALCCDVILAGESAKIGDGHITYGVFPGGGGAALLPQRIGLHRAKALLFTGESLPAATWAEWGFVHRVIPDDALDKGALDFAQTLARRSPLVLQRMKRVTSAAFEVSQSQVLREELAELRDHMKSADFREGLASFVERRTPNFE